MALLCKPDLTVRTLVSKLGNLNTMGIIIGSRVSGTKRQHSTAKGKVDVVILMDS